MLDPLGGSGTTLIACEKSGRQARLIELEPNYEKNLVVDAQLSTAAARGGAEATAEAVKIRRQLAAD